MGKKKLIDRIAERFDGNREVAQHALDSVVEGITRSLAAGEKVAIKGFGVFDRDDDTKAKKKSKRTAVPTFSPNQELKDVVAGVKNARSRVAESLSLVPAQAASAAETASRAASSAARAAAEVVRGEADSGSAAGSAGEPAAPSPTHGTETTQTAKSAPAKETAAKSAPAKKAAAKSAPAKKAAAKSAPAKKAAAKSAPAKKAGTKSTSAKKAAPPSDTSGGGSGEPSS
ncbi:HU family DNA-binding protein [Haloactinopolyspora alba]|uniref:HU family DNA-binding protein n=1 Tax=Haloactinopolyspora alba TaxID=648780 RepID=UPI00101CCD9C|nr:HU family DNA-binding protein [Haloactinopolyspora alba]